MREWEDQAEKVFISPWEHVTSVAKFSSNFGGSQEELPESLLGTVRLEHLDLSQAAVLDTMTGTIERK